MIAEEDRFVEADGLRIRYLEEGRGPAVVLLHGSSLGSSADAWSYNLPDLAAKGLRAIAVDLPGFGLSDIPGDPSLGYRTRFVPLFLDAMGLERAHLVGHSQAGRIAVTLALERAERVGRIVVVGTASMLPPLPGGSESGDADDGGDTEPTLEDTRRQIEESVFDRAWITREAVALRHAMSIGRNFEAHLARRAAKSREKRKDQKPLWQRLGEVPVPLRLVYGRQDRAAAERAGLARQLHPKLDLHLIEGCKHFVQRDAPEALAQLIGEFLLA